MGITYIETGSTSPFFNLAVEEYILKNKTEGDYILLWQSENAIVVGSNQNTAEEINAEFAERHSIAVSRRMTGGGAVYQDLGNLNYSFITNSGDLSVMTMEKFTTPVVKALAALGVEAVASGRNDILIGDKKISGTAQRLHKKRVLHHGTLLFNSNKDMIAGALKVDPSKFQSKSTKSVRSRVGNISDYLEDGMTLYAFWQIIKKELIGDGALVGSLTEDELAVVRELEERNKSYEWNYGRSPKGSVTGKKRFDKGAVEANIEVEQGLIKSAVFYGDFLALRPMDDVTNSLIGLPFVYGEIKAALGRFDEREYFGGITKEEVLSVIFDG